MQLMEEKRMHAEIAMLQKIEENKLEIAQKTEAGHALLTQNLLKKMCEDLASRVASPRGGGAEGAGLTQVQVQGLHMAMQIKMSAWEGRVGEFLEKMTKSHASDIEKLRAKWAKCKPALTTKMRKSGKKYWKSKLRPSSKLLNRIKGCKMLSQKH